MSDSSSDSGRQDQSDSSSDSGGGQDGSDEAAGVAGTGVAGDPTLAAVALGLGVAALIVALIPYLIWIALPLAVVAVVLGVLGRSGAGHVHAIVGSVAGGVAVVVVFAWVALLTTGWSPLPLAGLPDLTAPDVEEVVDLDEVDDPGTDEAPAADEAPAEAPSVGVATIEFDGDPTVLELDQCLVSADAGEVHAEGLGAAGSVVLRATQVEIAITTVTGPGQTTRILSGTPEDIAIERAVDAVRLDGPVTDLGTGQQVAIRLDVSCD